MKKIKIEKTTLLESKLKFQGDPSKEVDYKDLMEIVLDIIPQGGFTPKDIRDRNRIQGAIDEAKDGTINLEDSDYENFVKIIETSRWPVRDKEILKFLDLFKKS